MTYLLGLDIGTSSVKGILVDSMGEQVACVKVDFVYHTDKDGTVEIDAETFISTCFSAIQTLVKNCPSKENIKALCASSASGNLLLIDEEGNAMTPIYNWRDSRVGNEAKEILKGFDAESYYHKTGWKFDFKTFPLAMLCYIKKHNPELLKKCGKVCMSTEYLYYRLTSEWGIGTSAGTPFYLIEQKKSEYAEDVLKIIGINKEKLPPILKTGTVLGGVTKCASETTLLPIGVKVVLGSFDHPSAARGVGVLKEGDLLLSCGTSWVGFSPIENRETALKYNMLVDPFLSEKGPWGAMFSLASISDKIKLYISRYISDNDDMFSVFSKLSEQSSHGSNGLKINIYDVPDDSYIEQYPRCDIARAIMESTAMHLAFRLEELKKEGITFNSAVMVGGPSGDKVWQKVLSEVTGLEIKSGQGLYAGAFGASIIAGIGIGVYADEKDALNKMTKGK